MSSLNEVNLIGRLGNDPEVKYIPSGDAVCNISLATSERWTDKQSGEKKEKTEWHRLTIFGKLAEVCGQYLRKGSLAYFQGKLETRQWEKDGEKRYSTEVRIHKMIMLGGKEEGNSAPPRQAAPQQSRPQSAPQQPAPQQQKYDDDIPF